ncbi:MAG TPA: NADH-quinone oxidoreductase subunit J [Steroidobacteraceae bacterium]
MTEALICFFGALALAFAVLVVTLRQPMRAALALIAHMISLAALFACLGVHVVALFQILIYVGAVMVLMTYTIMLLDDRDVSFVHAFSRWWLIGVVAVIYLDFALSSILRMPARSVAATIVPASFSFEAFAVAFMRQYGLHFELVSVLLLVGIVAAWTVARERR